jgi:hypothetical protein
MEEQLVGLSHQTKLQLGNHTFTAQTTLGTVDQLHVVADSGAFGRVEAGEDNLTVSGGDEAGHTFTLRIDSTGKGQGKGTLTVGSFVYADSGGLKGMTGRLADQMSPEAKKIFPNGDTLLPYVKWLRRNRTNTSLIIGHSVVKAPPDAASYCESICACCEKGTATSVWCCISCASCDYFKNPVSSIPPPPARQ